MNKQKEKTMNKKITLGITIAILGISMAQTSHAWFLKTSVDAGTKDNRKYDNSNRQKVGGSAYQNSNNRATTNQNDNRRWSTVDSRNMSSNYSTKDSHNVKNSHNKSDSSRKNSHNFGSNARLNSHNVGSNSVVINGGYQSRFGHKKANIGQVSGSNNTINNSISGYSGVGHTTQK
jgi:hypothetical protein